MYELVSRVEGGITPLQAAFQKYVTTVGEQAIELLTGSKVKPQNFFDSSLNVWRTYNRIVVESFKREAGFISSLDKACKSFLNFNAITKNSNNPTKSPELLARYCDQLLKKGDSGSNENVEELFDQIVFFFFFFFFYYYLFIYI